jgi:nucleoside-diphosphate-sugar epimerase
VQVLVTGATGFIGLEVTRQLAEAGARPRVLVRRLSRAPLLASLDVHPVFGDLASSASLERALRGVDAVIHLGGRATFEPYTRLAPTLVEGTERLARLAAQAGVGRIVFGSSCFAYDGADEVGDATPAAPVIDYGRAKLAAERALEAVAAAGGPTAASVRLPHVYGPHSLLFGLVRKGLVPFPAARGLRFPHLHVDDAARVLVAAASSDWRGALPVADLQTVTWDDFFDVLRTYAPRTRVVRVPPTLARAGSRLAGPLVGRVGPTVVSADMVRGWNLDLVIRTRSLWDRLGLEPHHPSVLSGIPAVLDGMVAFRWRHPVWDVSRA